MTTTPDLIEELKAGIAALEIVGERYGLSEQDSARLELYEGCLSALEAKQELVNSLTEKLRKYMVGECDCPKADNPHPDAVHWPGCPIIMKGRLAASEARVKELETAFQTALEQTYEMINPYKPDGEPGSYARGHYNGIICAVKTLKEHYLQAQSLLDKEET